MRMYALLVGKQNKYVSPHAWHIVLIIRVIILKSGYRKDAKLICSSIYESNIYFILLALGEFSYVVSVVTYESVDGSCKGQWISTIALSNLPSSNISFLRCNMPILWCHEVHTEERRYLFIYICVCGGGKSLTPTITFTLKPTLTCTHSLSLLIPGAGAANSVAMDLITRHVRNQLAQRGLTLRHEALLCFSRPFIFHCLYFHKNQKRRFKVCLFSDYIPFALFFYIRVLADYHRHYIPPPSPPQNISLFSHLSSRSHSHLSLFISKINSSVHRSELATVVLADASLPKNVLVLPETKQIKALFTIIRNRDVVWNTFIFSFFCSSPLSYSL